MVEKKAPETRPARLTGPLKDGHTIADVMDKGEAYQHVLHELVATFDRLSDRLALSELQEEQTEIACAMGHLGTAIMLHKVTDELQGIMNAMPDGSYIAEAISQLKL